MTLTEVPSNCGNLHSVSIDSLNLPAENLHHLYEELRSGRRLQTSKPTPKGRILYCVQYELEALTPLSRGTDHLNKHMSM